MEICLPIADLSVNWAMIVLIGCAAGFLSGMSGVGGGGVQFASRLRGEQLRALPALAVAARLLYGRIAAPGELYSIVADTP